MINIWMYKEDMPKKCMSCRFLDCNDECVLLDEEENERCRDFVELYESCPVQEKRHEK